MANLSPKSCKINLDLGKRGYNIHIGEELISNAEKYIRPFLNEPYVVIVTDETTAEKWLIPLQNSLKNGAINFDKVILSSGEKVKAFCHLEVLVNEILSFGVNRKTLLIALGGGVIGDITGFAASIILRGINFIQIPTTLLAQVDSSIGGKTAINVPVGKNLVGSFYQPQIVLADTATLQTLPKRELLAGYVELIKHGLIANLKFFEWCEKNGPAVIAGDPKAQKYAIHESCKIKAQIVAADETELGRRAVLNLGHTFGHAFEKYSNFAVGHGDAISVGMLIALDFSMKENLINKKLYDDVFFMMKELGLNTKIQSDMNHIDLVNIMLKDKKSKGDKIGLVLIKDIGKPIRPKNKPFFYCNKKDMKNFLEKKI